MKKINELKERKFTSRDIDHCLYVANMNEPDMHYVKMENIFNWIKEEALKNGLTVKMEGERIMFITGCV